MAGGINIGQFRDQITLNYYTGETKTAMGSSTVTLAPYNVMAEVLEMNSQEVMDLGLKVQQLNHRIKCRPVLTERIDSVVVRGGTSQVMNQKFDRCNQFVELIVRRDR